MEKISPLLVENADASVMNNTVTSANAAFDVIFLFFSKKIRLVRVCQWRIRLSCPTREKVENGPSPEEGTEPADGRDRPSRCTHSRDFLFIINR
jgi:hypothetical protein